MLIAEKVLLAVCKTKQKYKQEFSRLLCWRGGGATMLVAAGSGPACRLSVPVAKCRRPLCSVSPQKAHANSLPVAKLLGSVLSCTHFTIESECVALSLNNAVSLSQLIVTAGE